MARTKGWSTSGRVASCVIVVAERTSFVSRSLSAMLGVLKIVAYSAGDSPPACVMSAVCTLLGRVLRSDQVLPLSSRSEEHTSELQSLAYLVCRLLLEKKKKNRRRSNIYVNMYSHYSA